jgi:2,4-dienoyl-CoA reductase-like NADH-dependent reductase (Old Yellow Enzyme family)
MSRTFRYKTANDLLAAAAAVGADVRLAPELSPLLKPAKVAGRTVGNRMAIQPMEGCDGTLDGAPDVLTLRRYERFGAGGAKLLWGEACAVVPEGRANPRQLLLAESHMRSFDDMLTACRRAHREAFGGDDDLLVGLQLTHSGRYSHARPVRVQDDPLLDVGPHAGSPLIDDDSLLRLQDAFVDAAHRAMRLGCDFIDLKQCHRYLLNELLAARRRPGRFGGSFENRTRFAREVLGRIRDACPGLILATRLNVFDGLPYIKGSDGVGVPRAFAVPVDTCWGTDANRPELPDLTEPLAYIRMLIDVGVSLVNVTMGNPYASPHLLRPFEYPPPDGYQSPEHPLQGVARHFDVASRVQRAFPELPVVGSGYSWLQAFALAAGAANVADGRVTFMGIGRGALAQPEFGRSVIEGRALDPKRICRTFSYCTGLMRSKHNEMGQFATGCPPFDKEIYGPIWKDAERH